MKRPIILLSTIALSVMAMSSWTKETTSPLESAKYMSFKADMRVLWSDHALWTRNVIFNIVEGAPGTTQAVDRLLKNQEDIGNAIKPYYGNAAGNALTVLMKTHITTTADLITAARNGDTPAYDMAYAEWYANGDSIAVFLNTANPGHFPLTEWKMTMKDHLDVTEAEVVARLNGDYAADITAYDVAYAQAMEMSDMLSKGIALQFPDRF